MNIHNTEIAKLFDTLADLLEVENANPFRVRAYRQAARVIADMSTSLTDMLKNNQDLTEIPGIGESLAEKIKTIIKTGKLPQLKQLEKRTPKILSELMQIEGLGPRRVQTLYKTLHVHSIKDLSKALKAGKVRNLHGFGEKIEALIKSGIEHRNQYGQRIKLADAIPVAESLLAYLKTYKGIDKIEIAGSYRRKKETIGDLDVLVAAKNGIGVIKHFAHFDEIAKIISQGTTRSSVHLHSGIQVDLRVVPVDSYGAALLYFTGSKPHNITLRKIANSKNLKINEYGIYKNNKFIAGKTETDVYQKIGLPFIEPVLRENRGEIEAAKKNALPKLIKLDEIKGDLHCHTDASDGTATLEVMALAAAKHGYEYIAITDHTQHLTIANGLDEKRLLRQIKAIDHFNAKQNNIRILKSSEIDILENGSLDLSDDILKQLDLTVCSIHSKFSLSQKKQTERIIRAMDNPCFNILAHPTGRLLNKREPYNIDLEKIMRAAKDRGCILEINAQPDRCDLNDIHCRMAKDLKLKVVISTDAHSISQLNYMQFGIYQAQRGWLEAKDVLNTRPLNEFKKMLKRN